MADKRAHLRVKGKDCPEFRVAFPQVDEPRAFKNQEPKFSVVMLFKKSTDISKLKKIAFRAAVEKFGEKGDWPEGLRFPFRDGDKKKDVEGFKDHIFVRASSKFKPGLVSTELDSEGKLTEISQKSGEFYAGCFAKAAVSAYAYDQAGNRGVSLSLDGLQKTRDGKSLAGGRDVNEEFEGSHSTDDDDSDDVSDDDSDDGDLG